MKREFRIQNIQEWFNDGGVLIVGYDMFRHLTSNAKIKSKAKKNGQTVSEDASQETKQFMRKCLTDPGADLVIFDEGHELKSAKSQNYKACDQIKTRRRIILTGTPLQNNLIEYYWLISFINKDVLRDLKSFKRLFNGPIKAGQAEDASKADIVFMKRRAYILQRLLSDYLQRVTNEIFRDILPPKFEYRLHIRLSEFQIKLYEVNLSIFV